MFDENIPIKVFTSYAHKDEELREELDVHLAMIKRHKAISIWNDRQIVAGEEWDNAIKTELKEADIILLLVSPRFLASQYIYEIEIKHAMKRHRAGTATVIPIILKPCDWKVADLAALQGLPREGKAITTWEDMDEALLNVTLGLRTAIQSVQKRKKEINDANS